jgi:antitoxin component YwqK of YwqJK toxin-antitoxin module
MLVVSDSELMIKYFIKLFPNYFLCLASLALCFSCYGDIFYLKNNTVLEGKIISEDEKRVWIINAINAKIGINRDDIEKIVPKEFVVPPKEEKKSSASNKNKPAKKKYNYGTMTAEITYAQASQYNRGAYKTTQYMDGKTITHDRKNYSDGSVKMSVRLQDGIATGPYEIFYKNGTLQETGFYKKGKKYGIETTYWPTGELNSKTIYNNNEKNGKCYFYYQSGALKEEMVYENGKKSGIEKHYYSSGQLLLEKLYINDKIIGVVKEYYDTGELSKEQHIVQGKAINYFKNGKIKSKIYFLKDKCIIYDESGTINYEGPIPAEHKQEAPDTQKPNEKPIPGS